MSGASTSHGEDVSALIGRWVLAWLYLGLTYHYASDWDDTVILLPMKGIPNAQLPLSAGIVLNVFGSVSLLLGFHTRVGALGMFIVTVSATFVIYDYWNISDAVAREAAFEIFARNVAIAAGLLLLVGMGPRKFAMDNRKSSDG